MDFINVLNDFGAITLISLIVLSFIAGFIDSVVGGGGLIIIPALLISLPKAPLPTIFGTNKISALSGTSIAAFQYAKRIKFNFKLLLPIALCAGIASFTGAKIVSYIIICDFFNLPKISSSAFCRMDCSVLLVISIFPFSGFSLINPFSFRSLIKSPMP